MADRREISGGRTYNRRKFLRPSTATALLLGGGATFLNACGSDASAPTVGKGCNPIDRIDRTLREYSAFPTPKQRSLQSGKPAVISQP